jgi:hypothetical protein
MNQCKKLHDQILFYPYQSLTGNIVLGYPFFLHPLTYLDGFEMSGIESLPQVIVIDPCRSRPQACSERSPLIELLVASGLTVVSHLKIVAIHILHIL